MNDDDYGPRLLSPLREGPAGPPTIDVVRAMRDGRRMRRRRWWAGGSALAAVLTAGLTGGLLVADRETPRPDPLRPPACTGAVLPMGSHKSAEMTGGDPSGAWLIGYSHRPDSSSVPGSAMVWHNGELVADVPPKDLRPGSAGIRLTDINSHGVAVGGELDGRPYPYVFEDGKFRRLNGGLVEATVINDAGVIAGVAGPATRERPVRWASPAAQPEELPLPDDTRTPTLHMIDVTPDGTIIAEIGRLIGEENGRAYLWRPDGTHGYLETPTVEGRQVNRFTPKAFNQGWLYGVLNTSAAGATMSFVYRYELRAGTWEQISDERWTAAIPGVKFGGGADREPQVFAGRSVLNLPPYPAPFTNDRGYFFMASISDDARVLSGVRWRAGDTMEAQPIIWRCR